MVSDLIGPVEAFKALDAKEIFRAYNPISGEMFFRGEVFSLKEISDALADVVTRAGATLQTLIAS
jgi:hypothetical protein